MPESVAERTAEPMAEARRAMPEQKQLLSSVVEHGGVYGEFREILLASGKDEPPPERIASALAKPEYAGAANAAQKARVIGEVQQMYGNAYAQRVVAVVRRLSAARPRSEVESVPTPEPVRGLPLRRTEVITLTPGRAQREQPVASRLGTDTARDAPPKDAPPRDAQPRDARARDAARPAAATPDGTAAPAATRPPATPAPSSVAAPRTPTAEASQSAGVVAPQTPQAAMRGAAVSESAPGSGGMNEAAMQTPAASQTTSPAMSPNATTPAPASQTAAPAPPAATASGAPGAPISPPAPAAPGGRPRSSVPPTGTAARRPASASDAAASSPQGAVPSLAPPNAGLASVGGGGAAATAISTAGASHEVMQNFTSASASQVAATYPVLGGSLAARVSEEQQAAVESIPPIRAQTGGVPEPADASSPPPPTSPGAQIGEGTTGGEPPPPRVEPHQNVAPPPRNTEQTRAVVEEQPDEGFFAWLQDAFTSLLTSISTTDPGLSTDAGERPQFDTSGEADPERATRQQEEGTAQVSAQQTEVSTQIANHPGQQQIQPVAVNQETRVAISQTTQAMTTQATDEMAEYAALSIPGDVRQNADAQMAPMLEQSLAAPRQEVEMAASARDQEQQAAIETTQQQAAELNQQAEHEQSEVVRQSRQDVAGEQERGLQESKRRMQEFNTEASDQQTTTVRDVNQRVEADQQEANESLSNAERDAEAERVRGEEEAAAKKRELERESDDDSWWDRAVDAVKSAVKAVTDAIDAVFTAVRNAVKSILDAAKNFAVGLIEAGRRWVVDKLQAFGNWLKSKVSEYLSAFPALAAAINNVIDRAVNAAVETVNSIADRLKAGVTALADSLGRAIDAALGAFQNALKGAVALVGAVLTGDFAEAARIVFMAACSVLGISADRLLDILGKAGDALSIIFTDPIGFLGNLIGAVRQGFEQFMTNILRHLASGLMGWLFGALEGAGLQLPTEFTLKAIFGLVMQVLGLTYDRLRAKAVKLIGEQNVEIIEKVWSFISTLITEGPAGLWEQIKEYLGDIKDIIFSAIQDWVMTQIVQAAVTKLVTMFNPVGAIVQAVLAIYNTVMFFIERINQIIALVESVVNSIYKIATGAIGDAANWVEEAMARTIPVIISFLARLIGLGGISEKIRSVIESIQESVDKAIDKVIEKARQMFARMVGGGKQQPGATTPAPDANAPAPDEQAAADAALGLEYPKEPVEMEDGTHTIWIKEQDGHAVVMMSSTPQLLNSFLNLAEASDEIPEARKKVYIPRAVLSLAQMNDKLAEIEKIKKSRDKADVKKTKIDALETELAELERVVSKSIKSLVRNIDISLFDQRYKLEGIVATYKSTPEQPGDQMTPDHQPAAAALIHVASKPEFAGLAIQQVAKGHADGGVTINLHERRHQEGRTYGSSAVAQASRDSIDKKMNAKRTPDTRRAAAIQALRDEMDLDVAAMRVVYNKSEKDAVWEDINSLTQVEEEVGTVTLKKKDKEKLIKQVRSQVLAGEDRLQGQDLDRLKN